MALYHYWSWYLLFRYNHWSNFNCNVFGIIWQRVDSVSDTDLGYMGVPFGLFFVWGIHKILDKKWKTKKVDVNKEIDLIGKNEEELGTINNDIKF